MSYKGLNSAGGIHHCYTFYERMVSCAKEETLPTKMCLHKVEDYLECINKKKQVFFYHFFSLLLIIKSIKNSINTKYYLFQDLMKKPLNLKLIIHYLKQMNSFEKCNINSF